MLMHPRWLFGVLFRYLATTGMPMYQNYPERAKAKMTAGPMGRSSLRTDPAVSEVYRCDTAPGEPVAGFTRGARCEGSRGLTRISPTTGRS
jgi:hypothetical protein